MISNYYVINPGDRGSRVASGLDGNFKQIMNQIETLQTNVANLNLSAMGGNNGSASSAATVNISISPSSVIARTDTIVNSYTVNVTVMLGQKSLVPGTDDHLTQFTPTLDSDEIISGGMTIAKITQNTDNKQLSYTVAIQPNAVDDGEFVFYIIFNDIIYKQIVPIILLNQESDVTYTQAQFISTIFKRSSLNSLPVPTGGNYESPLPSTLLSDEPNQGWFDGIPSGTEPLWTCHRKFTSDGKNPQESAWSTPILAMDSADFDVCYTSYDDGVPGNPQNHGTQDESEEPYGWHDIGTSADTWMATSVKQGNQWGAWSILKIKGENGTASNWKNTIYKQCDTDEGPLKPTGYTTDFIGNYSTLDPSDPNYGWEDGPSATGTWWMSCAYINGDTGRVMDPGWSEPSRGAGGSGQGIFVSTVFKRSVSQPSTPIGGSFTDNIPEGWSDGIPSGSDPIWQTHRRFTSDGASPQEDAWHTPIEMLDSDGFDCCYTSYNGVPGEPYGHGNQDDYKDLDPYGWHNVGSSADTWMATSYRNQVTDDDWSPWVITQIKGENGNDGNYTNYIFKECSGDTLSAPNLTKPENFVGKDDDDIRDAEGKIDVNPINRGWKDGPGSNGVWWMSCAMIDGTTDLVTSDGWSTPTKLTGDKGEDGSYTEYQYSVCDSQVYHPSSGWCDSVSGAIATYNHGVPLDEVPSGAYLWMKFRRWAPIGTNKELIAGEWEYARVTGEKGDTGTQLKINGNCDTYEELFLKAVDSDNVPLAVLPNDGDSYIVKGELWVWSASATWKHADEDTYTLYNTHLDPACWVNCGGIVGPSGATQYLHIKYASVLDLTDEETGKKYPSYATDSPEGMYYMGQLSSTATTAPDGEQNYKLYKWAKFTGDDGYGYEFIYKLCANANGYDVPTSANTPSIEGADWEKDYQKNDFVPSGWTDNPTGISDAYPYEYMCKRIRNNNGIWEPFIGRKSDESKAILYSYKGKDGKHPQTQYNVFTSSIYTSDMPNDPDWSDTVKEPSRENNEYLWQRTRTVTPAYGDTEEEYTEWEYMCITGERGNTGTGIQLNGSLDNYEELFKKAYTGDLSTYDEKNYDPTAVTDGEAWTVSGELWTWTVSNMDITDNTYEEYNTNYKQHHWRCGGNIQGEKGDTYYIHIKYANQASATTVDGITKYQVLNNDWLTTLNTPHDGELPGRFIGECHTTSNVDPAYNYSGWKWSKYQGDDGIAYEYIYTRTATNNPPHVPRIDDMVYSGYTQVTCVETIDESGNPLTTVSKYYTENDFVPCIYSHQTDGSLMTEYNWTDNPMGITSELPYEWACKREKIDGHWENFYGKASDTVHAFLYNKYGQNGLDLEITQQNYVYQKLDDGTVVIEDVMIEFIAARDGVIQTVDNIVITGDTNQFSTITPTEGGNANIYLVNKATLSGGMLTFQFTVGEDKTTIHTKKWQFTTGAVDGKDGVSPVQYELYPSITEIKYDSNGHCVYDDTIEVEIYYQSAGTRTQVNYNQLDGYRLFYCLDNSNNWYYAKTSVKDYKYASIPAVTEGKPGYHSATQNVVLKLVKGNDATGETCYVQTISVKYDGADGGQTNLYGYSTGLQPSNSYRPIHTNYGLATICTFNNGDAGKYYLDFYQDEYYTPFTSGKIYAFSFDVSLVGIKGLPSTILVGASFETTVEGTPTQTVEINGESKHIEIKGEITNKFFLYCQTEETYADGMCMLIVSNLKIENAENIHGISTTFNGLGTDNITQNVNQFQDSSNFSTNWEISTDVSILANSLQGNKALYYKVPTTDTTNYFYLGNQKIELEGNSWYTLSFYAKGSVNLLTMVIDIIDPTSLQYEHSIVSCLKDGPKFKNGYFSSTDVGSYPQQTHELNETWTLHTMTFHVPNSSQIRVYFIIQAESYVKDNEVYISMPKLEMGDKSTAWQANEQDRTGASSKPLRGPREWTENEVYEGGESTDTFQDLVLVKGNSDNMFLCHKTHTATTATTPSDATVVDSNWTVDKPWSRTEYTDFTATKILWTDNLMAEMMNVVEAKIDNLVTKRLQTESTSGTTLKIEDGTIEVYGTNSSFPDIRFGVDSGGTAVLQFYKDGILQYDLGGYSGLRKVDNSTVLPSFSTVKYKKLSSYSDLSPTANLNTTLYVFSSGKYWEITASEYNGHIYVGNSLKENENYPGNAYYYIPASSGASGTWQMSLGYIISINEINSALGTDYHYKDKITPSEIETILDIPAGHGQTTITLGTGGIKFYRLVEVGSDGTPTYCFGATSYNS